METESSPKRSSLKHLKAINLILKFFKVYEDKNFFREGSKKIDPETLKETVHYLSTANYSKMVVYLEGQLKIPDEVTITYLRPDIT